FADAAKKHSQAPTAKDVGNIGTIRRHEPMPEDFSKAAFALKKGEVSPPVVSPFGVHLIQVQEIIPGRRTWEDCREELRPAVTLYLFRWIAEKQRKEAKISY
ncbi:MAG: peptidyl-prolyl cis-trans isomerase, partial [Planctomycetales bacterium]|nr:peptidyl-prolyl cis-trans isomerase [Planctomycetales bacterium]